MEYVVTCAVVGMAAFVTLIVRYAIARGEERAASVWRKSYERINEDAQRLALKNAELQKRCVSLARRLEDMTRERDEAKR